MRVDLVHLVCLVHLVNLVQPNKQNRPNKQERPADPRASRVISPAIERAESIARLPGPITLIQENLADYFWVTMSSTVHARRQCLAGSTHSPRQTSNHVRGGRSPKTRRPLHCTTAVTANSSHCFSSLSVTIDGRSTIPPTLSLQFGSKSNSAGGGPKWQRTKKREFGVREEANSCTGVSASNGRATCTVRRWPHASRHRAPQPARLGSRGSAHVERPVPG